MYLVDVYVFDLEYERMYHASGHERNYKGVTERLFEQLIGDRKRSAGKGTLVESTFALANVPTEGSRSPVAATITAPAQSRRQLLNPTELRVLLTGNTLTGRTNAGTGYHAYYRPDGTMYAILLSGRSKGKRDDGTWEVTLKRGYCRQWGQWRKGEEHCFNFYLDGEKVIYEPTTGDEVLKGSGVMRTGNPENL